MTSSGSPLRPSSPTRFTRRATSDTSESSTLRRPQLTPSRGRGQRLLVLRTGLRATPSSREKSAIVCGRKPVPCSRERYDVGLGEYWTSVAWEAWFACRAADTITAWEQALAHLAQADGPQRRIARLARNRLGVACIYAPLPVAEALRRVRALAAEDPHPLGTAHQRMVEGRLLGMQGDVERARELVSGARQLFVDAGLLVTAGGMANADSELAFERGDLEQAELILLDGVELLERIGDRSYYPTLAVMLAHVLVNQQRFDDVPAWLDRARATTGTDDIINFVLIDAVDSAALAHAERLDDAEAAGRRSVELAEQIDFVWARPLAHSYFAETLSLAGKPAEAAEQADTALAILEAKGNVVLAARLRERLTAVGVDV